jgi:DNA-directed RNA polymerase II subunit RPB2
MIQNNRAGEETFTKPQPPSRGNINEQKYEEILLNFKEKYKHLDDRGVAKLGSIVKSGDIVITKIRTNKEQQSTKIISLKVPLNESGTVDRILITTNKDGNTIVRVRIRSYYMHIEGDKLASRTAQKSTIGLILPPEDMPFTSSGIIPDMILNPHAIPSRMTIGKLMEMMMSKLAVMKGERFNVTGFRPFDLDELRRNLLSYGYIPHGTEVMYSGTTGRKFNAQIFMGPVYYMALKHLVRFKIQQRQLGPVSTDTGQPVQGKQSGGGIRVGEMERDALISHGASNVIQDRLCLASDVNKEVFCINCGRIAISNYIDKKYKCKTCGDKGIFGTSEIPRAFKLLMDILAGMGIELKLGFKKT